jgi:SAM-dependent methyltransferase
MYDRESAALARRHDEAEHRELDEGTVDVLARVVEPPGPVADLGCGPGAHTFALARRGYDVVGIDGSPRMIEVARARAARDDSGATFHVDDLCEPLRLADGSLGGALAILVVQHLADPAAFVREIRRCLGPGGHLLIRAPVRRGATAKTSSSPVLRQNLSWRLRAATYTLVPGLVRFFDVAALQRLVEGQGFTVVHRASSGTSVTILAQASPSTPHGGSTGCSTA